MAIRVLDAATISKISAGEVVERPSSVIKELVENSLDAGATAVTVEIKDGGLSYIRVTDNGCGIPFSEARLAFENHATGKLKNADGLIDIATLGFRGEALPSIAAVSRMEMTTRERGKDFGAKVSIEGGTFKSITETGCPEGTTVTARDLFFNLPVRRAFMKKPSYEQGLVSDVVTRMILGNPSVSFRFISNGKTLYHSVGDGDIRHAALCVFGRECAQALVSVDVSEGAYALKGLLGTGDLARQTRAHQLFYINGRTVRCLMLSQALESAAKGRCMTGTYPMCALELTVPPRSIDVNAHPSKLEIRFRDEAAFRLTAQSLFEKAFIGQSMSEAFEKKEEPLVYEKKLERVETIARPEAKPEPKPEIKPDIKPDIKPVAMPAPKPITVTEIKPTIKPEPPAAVVCESAPIKKEISVEAPRETVLRENASASTMYAAVREDAPLYKYLRAQETQTSFLETDKAASKHRIIGTVFNTYILLELDDSLYIIDQHAAHERLNYEKLMKSVDNKIAAQQLLTPYIAHLSRREAQLVLENADILKEIGYDTELFGETDIRVNSVPFILGEADAKITFTEMLEELENVKKADMEKRKASIITAACKSAVKAGNRLTDAEIESLVSEMRASEAPPTCPHGRPVLRRVTKRELEQSFKRIV